MMTTIKVKAVRTAAQVPQYKTPGAAGADLYAANDEPVVLRPGDRKIIQTGLSFEIPEGLEVQIRPRSGVALKYGVTVLNTPGTIDSDYRGEIGVLLANHGHEDFVVNQGDRIAQAVVAPCIQVSFDQVDVLSDTVRGNGGFGSTGSHG